MGQGEQVGAAGDDRGERVIQALEATGESGWLSRGLSGEGGGLDGGELLDGEEERGGLEPIGAWRAAARAW
jgi:hypothetical protein